MLEATNNDVNMNHMNGGYINNQLDEKQQPTIMMPGNKLCIYWEISMVGVRLLENMY